MGCVLSVGCVCGLGGGLRPPRGSVAAVATTDCVVAVLAGCYPTAWLAPISVRDRIGGYAQSLSPFGSAFAHLAFDRYWHVCPFRRCVWWWGLGVPAPFPVPPRPV